jgi:Rap1a immunity proteins
VIEKPYESKHARSRRTEGSLLPGGGVERWFPRIKRSSRKGLCLIALFVVLVDAAPALSGQNPNEGGMLLQQCEAMLSGTAEIEARLRCENTVGSTLRAVDWIKQENPKIKLAYCAPGEVSVVAGARLYVAYVNTHPSTIHMPAEQVLIQALEAAYPCRP